MLRFVSFFCAPLVPLQICTFAIFSQNCLRILLTHNTKPDKELTNKQKERLKIIEREIEEAEKSLIEVEEILAKFDYTSMDDEKADLIQRLTAEKDKRESTVSELYEEWEELNS